MHDAFRKYLARKDTYGKTGAGRRAAKTGRLFLGRVRFPRIDPELFRRPRHSRRRPLQIGQRPRPEFRRHRLALSPRIFQTADRQGRHPARGQPEPEFSSPADPRSAAATIAICSSRCAFSDREVYAKVWELHVGRIKLYLLDTDIAGEQRGRSSASPRSFMAAISKCGCARRSCSASAACNALSALGIEPEVFHMNEGHSAFLALERIRLLVAEKKLDFYSALQVVASANVFTTHTPVPGGQRCVPARDDAQIFRRFRHRSSDSVRRIFLLRPDARERRPIRSA